MATSAERFSGLAIGLMQMIIQQLRSILIRGFMSRPTLERQMCHEEV